MRFSDPEAGWRKVPDMNKQMDGKLEVQPKAVFHINKDANSVTISEDSQSFAIGPKLVYMLS